MYANNSPTRLFSCIALLTLGLTLPLPTVAAGPCGVNTSNCMYPTADNTTAVQINKADGTTNVLNVDTTNARVGIGTTSPAAKLDVSGGVKHGNDTETCDSTKAGTLRWTGTAFEGCNGTAWGSLASNPSIFSGWPNVIVCATGTDTIILRILKKYTSGGAMLYMWHHENYPDNVYYIIYTSSGTYQTSSGLSGYDCVSNAWSISYLVAHNRTFN